MQLPIQRAEVGIGWIDEHQLGRHLVLGARDALLRHWSAERLFSVAARRSDPQKIRFARKAALAVGGFALVTSTIHFTMQARIDAADWWMGSICTETSC